MKITTDFPGGNIEILAIDGDTVKIKPDFRDIAGEWFYWAFCVSGAAGKTITFDFSPYKFIGYHGPAVSVNLKEWQWGGGSTVPYTSFTYTFRNNESIVYFAHDMLYSLGRFHSFVEKANFTAGRLCVSEKGRDVPVVRFGNGENVMLFTARHHCCESTGSYMLEGVLDEMSRNPITNYRVIAVPFVDIDGVIDGGQGKNRNPHDHNRDYIDKPIYASVSAIKDISVCEHIRYAFDFHSPWHTGGRNDKLFFVRKRASDIFKYVHLGKIFKRETVRNCIQYNPADDINPGVEWNKAENELNGSFSSFFSACPGVELALTIETPYFGYEGNVVSQDRLIETGRAFARSIRDYVVKRGSM